jgi:hypothetical protein
LTGPLQAPCKRKWLGAGARHHRDLSGYQQFQAIKRELGETVLAIKFLDDLRQSTILNADLLLPCFKVYLPV